MQHQGDPRHGATELSPPILSVLKIAIVGELRLDPSLEGGEQIECLRPQPHYRRLIRDRSLEKGRDPLAVTFVARNWNRNRVNLSPPGA